MPEVRFSVAADATERLDRFLADQLDLSRTQAARLVAAGAVSVNGAAARASRVLTRRDAVLVCFPDD
ncbi:MAG TPA: S4 domain-containing protein, partial [Gemmatimonadales bacterium]|nr:S4 domain-containing protein [Gemmatimonadales bacterium]